MTCCKGLEKLGVELLFENGKEYVVVKETWSGKPKAQHLSFGVP